MPAQSVTCPKCKLEIHLVASHTDAAASVCPNCYEPLPPTNDARTTKTFTAPPARPSGNDTASSILGPGSEKEPTHGSVGRTKQLSARSEKFSFLSPAELPDELGRFGPYRILSVLGVGGMGIVFRAEDPSLKRQIALKVMLPEAVSDPTDVARFLREARSQAAVEHDHVAVIHQVGEHRGFPFIAMPLLKGQVLADALKANPNVPVGEAIRIAREMAAGLAAAHEQGLVHRDIKPQNIWLEGRSRRVKILDFGLARAEAVGEGAEAVTQQGEIVGTPAYMSPEQAQGEVVDSRTDLFSLGVVLYQMLTARQPFAGKSTAASLLAVVTRHPPRPAELNPQVPPDLDSLTMRLLSKVAADRPPSAEAVAEALQAVEMGMNRTAKIPAGSSLFPLQDPWAPTASTDPDLALPAPKAETAVHPALQTQVGIPPRAEGAKGKPWLSLTVLAACSLVAIVIAVVESRKQEKVPDDGDEGNGAVAVSPKQGKETPKVPPKKDPPVTPKKDLPKPGDDRGAAEWVLAHEGTVWVNNDERPVASAAALPKEPFVVTAVRLGSPRATDAGPIYLRECKALTSLDLRGAKFTQAGINELRRALPLCRIQWEGDTVELTAEPDRLAAEYVLSVGGSATVRVGGTPRSLKSSSDVPAGQFQLTGVDLRDNPRLSVAGLAHFKGCKNLTHLNLTNTRVTDAGLAYFKECKGLLGLDLEGAKATDVGLAHFKGCDNLTHLVLKGCAAVTDAGLAHFKGCRNLMLLNLDGVPVGDVGLNHLKDCDNLTWLLLQGTLVGDTGLAQFADCKNLTVLDLSGTRVTDSGVALLRDCRNLSSLKLQQTKVKEAGILELTKALPGCKVEWDGGVIDPKK